MVNSPLDFCGGYMSNLKKNSSPLRNLRSLGSLRLLNGEEISKYTLSFTWWHSFPGGWSGGYHSDISWVSMCVWKTEWKGTFFQSGVSYSFLLNQGIKIAKKTKRVCFSQNPLKGCLCFFFSLETTQKGWFFRGGRSNCLHVARKCLCAPGPELSLQM